MNPKHSLLTRIYKIIALIIMTAIIVIGIVVFVPAANLAKPDRLKDNGSAYLHSLESRDVSHIDAALHKETAMEEIGDMGLWDTLNYFDTYVIGDSRCEPFLWTGLQPEHVLVEKSTTIKYVEERLNDIKNAAPGNLVLSFGMNDIGMYDVDPVNYWESAEDYAEGCEIYINMIREVSPDTNIYINSIIPALASGIERQPRWRYVDEWNTALREMCSKLDVGYIDTTFIATDYADRFDDDGVHFYNADVMNSWGEAILEAVEEREFR